MSGSSKPRCPNNALQNLGTMVAVGIDSDGVTLSNNDVSNVGTEFNFRNLTTDSVLDADPAIGTFTPVAGPNDVIVILGGSGNDDLTGTDGDDYIDANNQPILGATADTDTLNGEGGSDQLFGRFGNDTLNGGADMDALDGGGGADWLDGGLGSDGLTGGAGTDTAAYAGAATIARTLTNWTVTDVGGTDTLTEVEIVDDSAAGKTLLVGLGAFATLQEAVDAAADGDTILLAPGTYSGNTIVNKSVTILGVNAGVPGDDGGRGPKSTLNGGLDISADGVTIDGVRITGGVTGAGAPWPSGVYLTGDNFTLTNSVLDGDGVATNVNGDNSAILTGQVTGLDVGENLFTGYVIGAYVSGGGSTGSIHDNLFQGDGGPTTGLGNGVNSETSGVTIDSNTFDGLWAGVLNLFPFGPDNIDLNDYVIDNIFTDNAAVRPIQIYPTNSSHNFIGTNENEAFNGDTSGASGAFSFDGAGGDDRAWGGSDGNSFWGSGGTDQLFGLDGDDTLDGGIGNDALDGGNDTDTAMLGDSPIFFDTALGWVAVSTEGTDFLTDIEIAIDGSGDRTLLVGSTGFDTIQAAMDAAEDGDVIRLADGSYTETVNFEDENLTVLAASTAVLAGVVFGSTSNFGISVTGGDSADTVTTGGGDDVLNGAGGADILSGGLGEDLLDGGAGNDTMTGGGGDDTFIVDSASDQANEGLLGGTDEVQSSVTFTLGANVENLVLTGVAAINGTGNGLANIITGNSANNILNGAGGADTMIGGAGDDAYFVDDPLDQVLEVSSADGFDTVSSSVTYGLGAHQERLILIGAAAINGDGNTLDNILLGNSAANTLNGGLGADQMRGFGGDDIYFVDNVGDTVFEISPADGTDEVRSSVTFSLGSFQENLVLIGGTAIDGNGNTLVNSLTGNSNSNQLNGGAGADTMTGGTGDDTYTVDNVGDVVVEAAGSGTDLVKSGVDYTLSASIENLTLTGSAVSGTGNGGANTITGNNAANTLNGAANADTLFGSFGTDTLDGGLGTDKLYGGASNDDLFGGAGLDSFYFDTALNAAVNVDDIMDFVVADNSILLDRAIFTGIAADGAIGAAAFRAGSVALDADDRILYDAATGLIRYDADGIGGTASILFATVTPGLALNSGDFFAYT